MTHTAFFDLARQTAHAALNGSQQPALGGKLLTHLKVIAKCFVGDVVTVDEGTAEFLILAKTSASGDASLIDSTAALNTSDPDEPQYEFEWNPADSIQLRAVLDAAADPTGPVELRYEFRFERSGQKGCIGGPIWFLNNFFRPETPAPDATSDSSWDWLKLRAPEDKGFTHNDEEKTLAVESGGGTWGSITGTLTDQTDLAAALAAKATTTALSSEATARAAADTTLSAAIAALPRMRLGYGGLNGYTAPGSNATPAILTQGFNQGAAGPSPLTINGVAHAITYGSADADPAPDVAIDNGGETPTQASAVAIAASFASFINSLVAGATVTPDGNGNVTIVTDSDGAAQTLNLDGESATGTDAVAPSGAITEVDLITLDTDKKVIVSSMIASSYLEALATGTVQLGWDDGSGGMTVIGEMDFSTHPSTYDLLAAGATAYSVLGQVDVTGRTLRARIVGTVPLGGYVFVLVHALEV